MPTIDLMDVALCCYEVSQSAASSRLTQRRLVSLYCSDPSGRFAMPVIKITDLAYGRLRSPDLDKQEEFLTAFGMVRSERTKNALYMRGTDAPHHLHVTELGDPKYVGIAFHAGSEEDLDKLSR